MPFPSKVSNSPQSEPADEETELIMNFKSTLQDPAHPMLGTYTLTKQLPPTNWLFGIVTEAEVSEYPLSTGNST